MKKYRVIISGILTQDLAQSLADQLSKGIPDSLEVDIEEYEIFDDREVRAPTQPPAQTLGPTGIESQEGVNG